MEYRHRNQNPREHRRLLRGADGRLRPANSGGDIGDIWAEQRRIRLQEAIQEDQKKAEKKKARRSVPREIVVNLGLPKFKVPKLRPLPFPVVPKKFLIIGVPMALLVFAGTAAYTFFGRNQGTNKGVLAVDSRSETPEFDTLLPKGKRIEELGGWVRVSPPDEDPAFAYVDYVGGVLLNVSQQTLPEAFGRDPAGKLSELAGQFGANDKITAQDGLVFFTGTSAKGPQSVLSIKNDMLILIKSASKLNNEQWARYLSEME